MLKAIISDIHGNLSALSAVLDKLKEKNPDEIICCGDVVGYGAEPSECISLVMGNEINCVGGNHDKTVIDDYPIENLNFAAQQGVDYTKKVITSEERTFLETSPYVLKQDLAWFVHGSLYEPENFWYLNSYSALARDFELMLETNLLFVGHTHVPGIYMYKAENLYKVNESEVMLKDDVKYIINVGSVGQPRDRDSRAAYALYDTKKRHVKIFRVEYDIESTQERIRSAGLPEILATRLGSGW